MGFDALWGNPLFDLQEGDHLPLSYNFDHPDYTRKSEVWKTCRDAVEGQEAIKAGTTRYLPKLNGQTDQEYTNYLNRALYYNATGRTVQSYNGMIFRKDPIIKVFNKDGSEATDFDKKEYFKSVTNKGKSLTDLLHDVVDEVIQVNRVGILVDYPDEVEFGSVSAMTKYDKEASGYKPVLTKYSAESIVNWQYMYIGTTPVPVMYVVKEEVWDYNGSIFPVKTDIYRVMALEPYVKEGEEKTSVRYKQVTFKETFAQETGKRKKKVLGVDEVVYPMKNGEYMNFIPFYILTDRGIDFENLDNPMIYDLAVLNISHYMNSADLENELHQISIKTLYFPGWEKSTYGDPRLGGALAGPKDCTPVMLEASNKSGLADQQEAKETRMSVLGSEAISKQGRYVASAATAKISSRAESSILTTFAAALSSAFSEILTFLLEWDDNEEYSVEVFINDDLYRDELSAQELIQYMKAWQSGGLSNEAYFHLLQEREAYPNDWSMEQEFNSIRESMGALYDLDESKYVEVCARLDRLQELTKQMEVGAVAGLIAEGMPSNISGSEKIKEFEEGPVVTEEIAVDNSTPLSDSEENVENN